MPNYRFEYNDINYVVFDCECDTTSCVVYDIKKDMDIMHIPNLIKNPKYSINSPMYLKVDDFTNVFIEDILPKTSIKKFVLLNEKYHSLCLNNDILYTKQDGHIHSLLAIPPKLNIECVELLPDLKYINLSIFNMNPYIKNVFINKNEKCKIYSDYKLKYLKNLVINGNILRIKDGKFKIKRK